MFSREWKKGSTDLLVLSLLRNTPRHGYEIGKLIAQRSEMALRFHSASIYPALYRLEKRGWIRGYWQESNQGRSRRYYKLTAEGRRAAESQRANWRAFVLALGKVMGLRYA